MQNSIAFFDFDGTITRSDTLLMMAKHSAGTATYYRKMLAILPWLIAMKLKLISNVRAKEKMLHQFYGGMPEERFTEACHSFCEKILPSLVRPSALRKIVSFQQQNIPVVVVTASAYHWVEPWCRDKNIALIASKLEVKEGKITGRLLGKNCNNDEKACRIREAYNLASFDDIYAYGDTAGDEAMLALATHPFYRIFRD